MGEEEWLASDGDSVENADVRNVVIPLGLGCHAISRLVHNVGH